MKLYFYAIFCFLLFSVNAATPKELKLSRTSVKMLSAGLEFKPFVNMKAQQIKPLNLARFTRSDGAKIEGYNFKDLWLKDQKLATYTSSKIQLDFYQLNYLPPKGLKLILGQFVNEEQYRAAVKSEPWTQDLMKSWLKVILKSDVTLENKFPKLTFSIKQRWIAYDQPANHFDFLIISADKRYFYLHAKVDVGTPKEQLKAVTDCVKNIRINRAKAVGASNQSSKVRVNTSSMSSTYKATVQKVIKEVANTEGWWYAQTPNYILKSNLSKRSKSLAKKVQIRVEVMRTIYEAFIPPITKIDAISVITFPNTREEYAKYSDSPSWSAGVWNSSRKELIISNFDDRSKRQAETQMMSTLNHEAFHQYIYYALQKKQSPAWFNEGHADMFASVKIIGSKVTVIEDTYALRTLSSHLKNRSLSLERHINSGYQEFYANKDINYPLSWALVYFLRKAGPLYKAKGYDKILENTVAELVKTGSEEKATKKGFYGIAIKDFEKDFYDFWNDKRMRSKAARTKVIVNKRR
jgi:hypothetical protein